MMAMTTNNSMSVKAAAPTLGDEHELGGVPARLLWVVFMAFRACLENASERCVPSQCRQHLHLETAQMLRLESSQRQLSFVSTAHRLERHRVIVRGPRLPSLQA